MKKKKTEAYRKGSAYKKDIRYFKRQTETCKNKKLKKQHRLKNKSRFLE
jgi:hypothetical protein